MNRGPHYVHETLKNELIRYLKSQYLGVSEVLLNACDEQMEAEGNLWTSPYIESSPAYETVPNGIAEAEIPSELKELLLRMADAGLGVFPSPFRHQKEALEAACRGQDIFVSTGTGSGKTECFMWPLVSRLAMEAIHEDSWRERSIRTIVMYPMNALVADQIGRLRRMIGDPDGEFLSAFHAIAGPEKRRPQFGMYTGRTPYPGPQNDPKQDRELAKSLSRLLPRGGSDPYYAQLMKNGKIPAKKDMNAFIDQIKRGIHETAAEDAEMVTRFEIMKTCPDILITNYSMLEYMMLRSREDSLWEQTSEYYRKHPDEKMLFIIDEAHMYRGSAGGEVALLIQRLMNRIGINRKQMQFILTTASMPNKNEQDRAAVKSFACELTSTDNPDRFVFLRGTQTEMKAEEQIILDSELLSSVNLEKIESNEEDRLTELMKFISGISDVKQLAGLEETYLWLYKQLPKYKPFQTLFGCCRGNAVALDELARLIFPGKADAVQALDAMLTIAPLAHDKDGNVLFPARMHMLFRGFSGVYACLNPNCPEAHEGNGLRIGDVFLNDRHLSCPHCGSRVYELYTDRRCGALFIHGFVTDIRGKEYLWHSKGAFFNENQIKELHFYLPMEGDELPEYRRGRAHQMRCWLDFKSGFISFDDSVDMDENYRELWYSIPAKLRKDNPDLFTFGVCPKCKGMLTHTPIRNFSTRGNEPFYNVIQSQFNVQAPASRQKEEDENLPNDGRKVLLFSDSRQKAARLARDMSISSDNLGVRKLFMIGLSELTRAKENSEEDPLLEEVYTYMVREAAKQNLDLFSNESRSSFRDDLNRYKRTLTGSMLRRRMGSILRMPMSDAPQEMMEHMLRLFCSPYTSLSDNGLCFVEPEFETMYDAIEFLHSRGIQTDEELFTEVFSAVSRNFMVDQLAIFHWLPSEWRSNTSISYGNDEYGISNFDELPGVVAEALGCKDNIDIQRAWMDAIRLFMTSGSDNGRRFFLNPARITVRYQPDHIWYRCPRCARLSPFRLNGHCPSCGSSRIETARDFRKEAFWREGVLNAMQGEPIRVIDTEEHTAQLGHKDQRNNVWAQTEEYEMRFQDLVRDDEKPIDILSSTTTMEVGIDIGSLVAVGLRNMPPMRENYQQRAGRAGRRGASLSTIVTFAEGGPHDSYYFDHPVPMFRGEPRSPWIDIRSGKLIERHLKLILLNETVRKIGYDLNSMPAIAFFENDQRDVAEIIYRCSLDREQKLLGNQYQDVFDQVKDNLVASLAELKEKVEMHPELYAEGDAFSPQKSLLDALYEEGMIPTYSFPKDVVSTYIEDENGALLQQVDRGLDMAISEYAPGRAIVVDKKTYVIGGFYVHHESRFNFRQAAQYLEDPNYTKSIKKCTSCGWFGFAEELSNNACPFCRRQTIEPMPPMVRPWGFSPRDNKPESENVIEEYSTISTPLYSTLPDESSMEDVRGCIAVRKAVRQDQRIILVNSGSEEKGFTICRNCGAVVPGNNPEKLRNRKRPGAGIHVPCRHENTMNIVMGYDFLTDMLVLTFDLPKTEIEHQTIDSKTWMKRAGTTTAEALRKAATLLLDVEYDEIQSGFRIRENEESMSVDVYLYDNLSSGAGYSTQLGDVAEELLESALKILNDCDCDHACQKCLKHYRNQYIQDNLDRHAAIELIEYGKSRMIAERLDTDAAYEQLQKIERLLREKGIYLNRTDQEITLTYRGAVKTCIVYPSMMKCPAEWNAKVCVPVTIEALKDAKPYVLKTIMDRIRQ